LRRLIAVYALIFLVACMPFTARVHAVGVEASDESSDESPIPGIEGIKKALSVVAEQARQVLQTIYDFFAGIIDFLGNALRKLLGAE